MSKCYSNLKRRSAPGRISCNGTGKTNAAYALLPNLLDCRKFVKADEIARGLSSFQPEAVSVQAVHLMWRRLWKLLAAGETFALETTPYLPLPLTQPYPL